MTAVRDAAAEAERQRAFGLHAQGRLAEAAALYQRLVERDPDDFEVWNNFGNLHRAGGNHQAAVAALERAVALQPELAMLRLNLGGALAAAGRLQGSLGAAAEAARLAPDEPACQVELSRAYARLGDTEAAAAALERAAALAPANPGLRLELGLLRASAGDLAGAEAAYRDALRIDPGFVPAILFLGILYEHSNRADALGALVAEAQARRVPDAELALLRAFLLRREGRHAEALAAARAASPDFEPLRRAQLIGDAADRLGDAVAAFAAFTEMNRLSAMTFPNARESAAVYRTEVEDLLALTTPEWIAGWSAPAPPSERPAPVFLMGFPRSGTTLLDTVLMGHERLHVVEEQPLLQPVLARLGGMERLAALDAGEIAELRRLYFQALDAQAPPPEGRLVVDKMPLNIARLPLIHRLFPEARILFALRHPCDVVLSCFITSFGLNYAMANFLDLGDAARLYDLVMRYWLRCRELLPLDVRVVRYEALVEDVEGEVRGLIDHLGLDWTAAMLDHRRAATERGYVASASYAQVTEPVYGRAAGRWTRYRDQLAPVMPILAPWAEEFGYPT